MAEIDVQRSLLDDIREFIDEKWKHSECELCGTDRWMVYPEPNSYAYLIAAGEPGMVQPFAHATVAYIPLSCSNCGNLRLVDARIFEIWRGGRTKTKE
jgi:hypothetical protein